MTKDMICNKYYKNFNFPSNVKTRIKSPIENIKKIKNSKSLWEAYCCNSSVHGIKYVSDKNLHRFEKIIWAFVVFLAIIGTYFISIRLSFRFFNGPVRTDIESTTYPVGDIPFPAVTICNNNRINWNRIDGAVKKFLPANVTKNTVDLFKSFVSNFDTLQYGSFAAYEKFRNISLKPLDNISLQEVAEYLKYKCEEIFLEKCWWRNKYYNCCDIFVRQYSEYGICYAFNSVVNSVGRKRIKNETNWPWRTNTYGSWSGLRFSICIDPSSKPPSYSQTFAAIIIIHHPQEWPTSIGTVVPVGTKAIVSVTPTYTYAHETTRRIPPDVRECIFKEEAENFSKIWGSDYLQNNCMAQCRQHYSVYFCNCTIKFFYPQFGDLPQCNASAFKCLEEHSSILNYQKPWITNQYFNTNEEGIVCKCLLECHSISYKMEISSFILMRSNRSNQINFEVHFQHPTLNKYKIDVLYGRVDLLVSFGGIAGLFTGSSMLSSAELLYFLIIGIGVYFKKRFQRKSDHKPSIKKRKYKFRNNASHKFEKKIKF